MGIMDRLMGRGDERHPRESGGQPRTSSERPAGELTDEQAIARYRYMLKTAPPETIEQAHEEAFAKLTPDQRRLVLEELGAAVPAAERAAGGAPPDDPQTLARMATRAEMRQPGTMERVFGGVGRTGGPGFGSMLAGSLLGSIAGTVVGSMIAQQFFSNDAAFAGGIEDNRAAGEPTAEAEEAPAGDESAGADTGDQGLFTDAGSDLEAGMDSDFGGDFGGDI